MPQFSGESPLESIIQAAFGYLEASASATEWALTAGEQSLGWRFWTNTFPPTFPFTSWAWHPLRIDQDCRFLAKFISKKITLSYCLGLQYDVPKNLYITKALLVSWKIIHSANKQAFVRTYQVPDSVLDAGNREGGRLTRFLLSWSLYPNGRDNQKLKHKDVNSKYHILISQWALHTN